MAFEAPLFDSKGKQSGVFELPETLFGNPGTRYALHEVVTALQANQRRGTSSTKTRGLVSGGGRKPWKQKGTGNARAGSIRSPLWRGGGIIFGPSPRSYRIDLGETKKTQALFTALNEKAKSKKINVLDLADFGSGKTSDAVAVLEASGFSRSTLLVVNKREANLSRAVRNISWLKVLEAKQVNALDLLRSQQIIFLKSSFDILLGRIPKG